MAGSTALSGLASGVDTGGIVDKLMAVERLKAQPITNRQTRVTAQQSALRAIAAKLTAFQSTAAALKKDSASFTPSQPVTSSDPTKVQVAKIAGAGIGGHTLQVDRLASSAQAGFAIGDLSAGGTITIGSGTQDPATGAWSKTASFAYDAGATAASVAERLNADSTAPVYAAVVKNAAGEDRLVLSARATGESSRFEVSDAGPTADPVYASPAGSLNARYRVDGSATVQESQTNTVENAVAGLRLTLKGVATAPVSITVDAPDVDRTAIATKVKAVVSAYNDLVTTTRAKLDEKSVVNPATTADLGKGTLFGDVGLSSMLASLRTGLRDPVTGVSGVSTVTRLADIGVDIPAASGGGASADAKAGKLVVDDAKLDAALQGDWTKVAAFLDAFSTRVDGYVKAQTGSAGALIDGRVSADGKALTQLSSQLTKLNERLDAQKTRLEAQFTVMETALGKLQSQQSWLTGQLATLR